MNAKHITPHYRYHVCHEHIGLAGTARSFAAACELAAAYSGQGSKVEIFDSMARHRGRQLWRWNEAQARPELTAARI